MAVDPIPVDLLYRACDLTQFTFDTTAELEELPGLIGQERVLDALKFGTGIKRYGYNLFVLGPDGAGKHEAVTRFLGTVAARQKAPSDWAYVNNFQAPNKPIVLEIAAGSARALKEGMGRLVEELKATVPSVLESEEYQNRRQSIDEEYRERQERSFEALREKAEGEGIALLRTPAGFALAPVHRGDGQEGEVLKPEEFNKLPEAERKRVEMTIQGLQKELADILEHIPGWEKEHRGRVQKLNSEVAEKLVEQAMRDVRARFDTMPAVRDWLATVAADLIENIAIFATPGDQQQQQAMLAMQAMVQGQTVPFGALNPLRRYEVNVVVENNDLKRRPGSSPWQAEPVVDAGGYIGGGAPIVYEDHPTLQNLVGRVE
ncbi:MAG: ATP-binding protein, partial [Parvibaculum sedimenti]